MNQDQSKRRAFKLSELFDKSDGAFTWRAPPLSAIINEKTEPGSHVLTRREFYDCFLYSIERAAILCFAAATRVDPAKQEISATEDGRELVLSVGEDTRIAILSIGELDMHRFNVVTEVIEEMMWHFYKLDVLPACLELERSEDGVANICHLKIGSDKSTVFVIRSADFIRTKIEEIVSFELLQEWKIKPIGINDTFGWRYGGVKWNNERNEKAHPPPSFLTFQEFSDSIEGSVFLVNSDGLISYNTKGDYKSVQSDHLINSFDKYAIAAKSYLSRFLSEEHSFSLSLCSGTRFSDEDVGRGRMPMEGDELLGVFLTLIVNGVAKNKMDRVAERIMLSSGYIKYILLRNLAREKAHEQRHNLIELEKRAHMLKLLEGPLAGLTEALNATQEDAHILRSILYDPHKSIFSVAPLVEQYFETKRWCSYGRLRWKTAHKWGSLGGTKEIDERHRHGAACSLSAILCHIFGQPSEGIEKEESLYWRVVALLDSNDPSLSEIREQMDRLLFENDEMRNDFLMQLKICLGLISDRPANPQLISNSIINLKHYIFTPFKYQGLTPVGPLCLILYDNGYQEGSVKDILKSHGKGKEDIFPKGSLPTARYSDVLNLISGILSYVKEEYPEANIIGYETPKTIEYSSTGAAMLAEGGLEISFDREVVPLSIMSNIFELMIRNAQEKLRLPQGNFTKPFFDFASTLRFVSKSGGFSLDGNSKSLRIPHDSYREEGMFEEVQDGALVLCIRRHGYDTKLTIKACSISMFAAPTLKPVKENGDAE